MKISKLKLTLLIVILLLFVVFAITSCSEMMPNFNGDGASSDPDDSKDSSKPECKHSWANPETLKTPTCGTDDNGVIRYTCKYCSEVLEKPTYPYNEHTLEKVTVREATCGVDGLVLESCVNCEYSNQYTVAAPIHELKLMQVPGGDGECAVMCPGCMQIEKYVEVVRYEDYGAVGDGVTDDADAIRAAHAAANSCGLPVEGKEGAVYYIGAIYTTINIKTDTDWKGARFIFADDTISWYNTTLRKVNVFTVASDTASKTLTIPSDFSLSKGQTNIGMALGEPCMLKIENANDKIYIRYGANANSGVNKNEIILVDAYGNVDPTTPIQYDYDVVTKITKYSISDKPISVGNGTITTVVPDPKAQDPDYENNYCYFSRGIEVRRSNATLYSINHNIVGEDMTVEIDRNGDGIIDKWGEDKSYGVPYSGFFLFKNCNNAVMTNCVVQGHQAYSFYQGTVRNEMGSYDISATECVNLQLLYVTQYENESTGEVITNRFMYHGVMGSNFCRNVVMDHCRIDRFDAHQGLHNAKITNSVLGFGILVIGGGELYIENVYRISEGAFIHLRSDYNSIFDGDIIIKDCVMGSGIDTLINGTWRSFYNGLPNYMARSLTVEGLKVEGNRRTIYAYNISGAGRAELPLTDETNKLYLPDSIVVSNVTNSSGASVTVSASKKSDVFSDVEITIK